MCRNISLCLFTESVHTLKIHVGEKNCISLLDSEIESENSAKTESADNRLQIRNIDFKWAKVDENITEIKENTKDIAGDILFIILFIINISF